ncbi:LysE family translocator [Rhizobium sp. BK251]|uniref:LysE family translocator n=1 Tax=Rhizobium sp. BK251 TaxID=2512125 RepID=UPI0010466BC9|nr:LysE family translocator [Rhizobium sp. BK251]TCL76040.1 threonine/homoserine/homoserine lactone efflux protein [Rhizobium sp. BK251]
MTLDYLLTSIVVILLPGTGVLYTLAHGLSRGWHASILAAFGCTLGILPHMAASLVGLAALLHTSALAFEILKYLGVVYMLYMAWSVWRDGGQLEVSAQAGHVPATRIVLDGLLLNVLNPKLSIFFLAFLPQFVPQDGGESSHMLELAGIFMLLTFVIFLGYGAFASATRRYVIARPGVILWARRGFAAAFGLLGAKLALSTQ